MAFDVHAARNRAVGHRLSASNVSCIAVHSVLDLHNLPVLVAVLARPAELDLGLVPALALALEPQLELALVLELVLQWDLEPEEQYEDDWKEEVV